MFEMKSESRKVMLPFLIIAYNWFLACFIALDFRAGFSPPMTWS